MQWNSENAKKCNHLQMLKIHKNKNALQSKKTILPRRPPRRSARVFWRRRDVCAATELYHTHHFLSLATGSLGPCAVGLPPM